MKSTTLIYAKRDIDKGHLSLQGYVVGLSHISQLVRLNKTTKQPPFPKTTKQPPFPKSYSGVVTILENMWLDSNTPLVKIISEVKSLLTESGPTSLKQAVSWAGGGDVYFFLESEFPAAVLILSDFEPIEDGGF
jgi:hypothetical protein